MANLTLFKQTSYSFSYNRTILISDLNYQSVVSNDTLARILQEARLEIFRSFGGSELDLGDGETGIIIYDLVFNLFAPFRINDQITICSKLGQLTPSSFRIYHKIVKQDKISALAEAGLISYNYHSHKTTVLPEVVRKNLENRILLESNST